MAKRDDVERASEAALKRDAADEVTGMRVQALRDALEPFKFDGMKLSGVEAATFNAQVPEAWVKKARSAWLGKGAE